MYGFWPDLHQKASYQTFKNFNFHYDNFITSFLVKGPSKRLVARLPG